MRKSIVILFFFAQTAFSQKDSISAINNFYLEISAGPGVYNSQEGNFNSNYYYYFEVLSINFNSSFYYKNNRIKTEISYGNIFVSGDINRAYSVEAGVNLFSKNAFPQYFGPNFAYGFLTKKFGVTLGQRFMKFGVDYFYNKFHVGVNYQWIAFENAKFRTGDFKTTNIYLEIGYAFNLESFRKKK